MNEWMMEYKNGENVFSAFDMESSDMHRMCSFISARDQRDRHRQSRQLHNFMNK
jgi:hypothetical protein